jgi:hypothetical protein
MKEAMELDLVGKAREAFRKLRFELDVRKEFYLGGVTFKDVVKGLGAAAPMLVPGMAVAYEPLPSTVYERHIDDLGIEATKLEKNAAGNITSITGKIKDNAGNPLAAKFVDIFYTDTSAVHLKDTTKVDGSFFVKRSTTGVEQIVSAIPDGFALTNNYPNPFNPSTNIEFSIPSGSHVTLKVFDLLGREVGTFADGDFNSGKYKATLELNGLANGVYFAVFHAEEKNTADGKNQAFDKVQKLLLLYGSQHNTNPVHEAVKVGEVGNVSHNSNLQSTSPGASDYQHLSKSATTKIDSIIVSGTGITRTKLVNIPVSSDSIDLGNLVVNSAPKQTVAIPSQVLREVLDSLDIDLNQFVSNDNATQYASQNPKILIVGSHAKFRPDSSDISGNYTVRAFDLADTSLFVNLVIPVNVQHPNKLIVGPVYDLFTKFAGKVPIQGMKVYLGSDASNSALTDANGMATLKTWKTGKDSIYVVGATPADTAFYFWHKGVFSSWNGGGEFDKFYIKQGDNIVKAFGDTTGIPTWQRKNYRQVSAYKQTNGGNLTGNPGDTVSIDLLDWLIKMEYTSNSGAIVTPVTYFANDSVYINTKPRIRDEDMPAKVWLNRSKDPTGGWYADSAWAGIKGQENERLKFIEVTDSTSAIVRVFYTNGNVANNVYMNIGRDANGPYLSDWHINIRGPPGSQILLADSIVSYTLAHEVGHMIKTVGSLSSFPEDIMFDPEGHFNLGYKTFRSNKEDKTFRIKYLLERNPKLLNYFK